MIFNIIVNFSFTNIFFHLKLKRLNRKCIFLFTTHRQISSWGVVIIKKNNNSKSHFIIVVAFHNIVPILARIRRSLLVMRENVYRRV